MKKLIFLLFIAPIALSACGTSTSKPESAPSLCYLATVGEDQARIKFDNPLTGSGQQRGELEYAFAQKDQSWGIFTGEDSKNQLKVNYQFSSEGIVSYRDIVFVKKSDGSLVGDGFTFKPSTPCIFTKTPSPWKNLETSNVKADTFHDPETGYYARLTFEFPTAKQDMKIRCIGEVADANGATIARWINIGFLGTGNINNWNMGTNIRPDQVDSVDQGKVTCEYS
jgi:hypothetical protein